MIENFRFNDIVLYCKGWYQTPEGEAMLDDLAYLFGEIYGWRPKTEEEIAHFMLIVLDNLFQEQDIKFKSDSWIYCFSGFSNEVKKKMRIYDCSYDMAIILTVRSILQHLSVDEIKLNKPVYGKGKHFRMGSLFTRLPLSMTYKEMNRRAAKIFGEN